MSTFSCTVFDCLESFVNMFTKLFYCYLLYCIFLFCIDLESRFQFSDNIPEPEQWVPGPKTYPSKNVKKGQCLIVELL